MAPMAGVTTLAYRMFLKSMGCRMFITEMVSAKGMHYKSKNTFALMKTINEEHEDALTGLQIFGSDPSIMAEVTEKYINATEFDFIDINMGCPMRKIVNNGDGSALLKDPEKVYRVVKAVKNASDKPVTVKTRLGYESINITETTLAMQEAGADMISVHARTKEQVYSGEVDYESVKKAAGLLSVPVVANGDITTAERAMEVLDYTGAAGLMVGRGENYNPFLIDDINRMWKSGEKRVHTLSEKMAAMRRHFQIHLEYTEEKKAVKEFRKYLYWYIKGMRNSAKIRAGINQITKPDEILGLFDTIDKVVEEEE